MFTLVSFQHGIVFDAGSSRTNMSIYRWPEDKNNGTGKVQQIASCQPEGEISSTVFPCVICSGTPWPNDKSNDTMWDNVSFLV